MSSRMRNGSHKREEFPSSGHETNGSLPPPEEESVGDTTAGERSFEGEHVREGIEDVLLPHMAELEARATVKFDKGTFIKEELYHNFFPLSIPFMYCLEGKKWALINRGFMGWKHWRLAMFQWFLALNFYILNIMSLAYAYKATSLDFLYDVVLIDILWFMRNMVVATKYAFLSKTDMEEMRTGYVSNQVHDSRQFLSAWRDPIPSRVLKNELLLAAVRVKHLFRNQSFPLDTELESNRAIHDLILYLQLLKDAPREGCKWDTLADRWLESGYEELADGSTRLPARLYAAHVIHQASSLRRLKRIGHCILSQHIMACAVILGVAHAVLLTTGRFVLGGHKAPGPSWSVYSIVIPGFVLTTFSMMSNTAFMMVGILDFRRRHFVSKSLDELLRTGSYKGCQHVRPLSTNVKRTSFFELFFAGRPSEDYDEASNGSSSSGKLSGDGVVFDFQNPDSLIAWWACRQLMQNFGLGFYKRIKYYTIYFAGYCAVLLLFVVVKMLTGIRKDDIYLIMTVIFSTAVFLSLLALMVWPGGDTNNMLQNHGHTLASRKINIHSKTLAESDDFKCTGNPQRSKAVLRTITSISEAVKWDNMKSKLSVCGFEARDQLVSVIIAVVAATMSIGAGQIVQNGFAD